MKEFTLFIILLFFMTGCTQQASETETPIQKFEIRPTTTGNCAIDETGNFTLLVMTNDSEVVNWTDTYITFDLWALAPPGKRITTDDRITLYYSVEDFDTQLFKYNGAYQIKWALNTTDELWYERGSKTMSYRSKHNLTLEFDFNIYEIARVSETNLNIVFKNKDNSWQKVYKMRIFSVETET